MPSSPPEGIRSRLCSADNMSGAGPAITIGSLQAHDDRDCSTPSTPTLSHVGAHQNDVGYRPSPQNAFQSKTLLREVVGNPFRSSLPVPSRSSYTSGLHSSGNLHLSSTNHEQDTVVRRQGFVLPSLRDLEAGTACAVVRPYTMADKDYSNIPPFPRPSAFKPGPPRVRSALTASFWSTVIGEGDSCKGEATQGRCDLIPDHIGISRISAKPSGPEKSTSIFPPYHSPNSNNEEQQILKEVAGVKANALFVAPSSSLISDARSKTGVQATKLPVSLPPMSQEAAYGSYAGADNENRLPARLSHSSKWTMQPREQTQSAFASELSCPTEDFRQDSRQPFPSSAHVVSGCIVNSNQPTEKGITHYGTGVSHSKAFHVLDSEVTGLGTSRVASYAPTALAAFDRGSTGDESSTPRQQSCIPNSHARLLLAAPSTPPAPFSSGYHRTTPTATPVATPASLTSSSAVGQRNESLSTRDVSSLLDVRTAGRDFSFAQDRNYRTCEATVNQGEANVDQEINVQLEHLQGRNQNANNRNTGTIGTTRQYITDSPDGRTWNAAISALQKRQGGQGIKRSNPTSGRDDDDEPNYKVVRMANIVDTKPFKCNRCDTKFDRVGHLQAHIRAVHHKEKPYPCPSCSARFGHSSSLLRHKRTFKHDERVKAPRATSKKPMSGADAEPRRDLSSLYP
jgi:hypothetical protein